MTKEEHNNLLNDLKTCTSDVDRMGIIVKLENDYTGVLAEVSTATENAKNAQETADKYAKLNNELWLSNSNQDKAGAETGTDDKDEPTEPPQKRTFEDLEDKF